MARKVKPWPVEARRHYIRLFSSQERLRAFLKVAQETALAKRLISYQNDLLPRIEFLLREMRLDISRILEIHWGIGHRAPKWYTITRKLQDTTGELSQTVQHIEHHLLRQEDAGVIKRTRKALVLAHSIREILLSLPLEHSRITLDEYGFETIQDLTAPDEIYYLDLTTLWQQSRKRY